MLLLLLLVTVQREQEQQQQPQPQGECIPKILLYVVFSVLSCTASYI